MKNYDVIIIGGGASGLMCAISAKLNNKKLSVAVIEKNDRVGKKLLSTGNGRCNLTNKYVSAQKYRGSFREKSKYIFEKYDTNKLIEFFNSLGLLTYADNKGRYYPLCRQASAVLDVIRFACDRLLVDIFCSENIRSVKKYANGFEVTTASEKYFGKKLVIACGSKASPKLGGNASGADYLRNFGHKFAPFSPALCPIKVKSKILKSLKGLRAIGNVTLYDKNYNSVKEEYGEIQFTENALSGICIFNMSLYANKGDFIEIDLMNNYSEKELFLILIKNKNLFGNLEIDNLLTGIFQKRLAQAVLKMSGITGFGIPCKKLDNKAIAKIANTIKHMRFEIEENAGFEQAQACLGGVVGNEIDEKTMQSKLVKNLYICGESVDLCGECGGFNLHFAFSSGLIAGENL